MSGLKNRIWILLLICSIGLILYFTIFTRDIGAMRMFKGIFWELSNGMWKDISLNILLFIPFGFFAGRIWGWKAVMYGLLFSVVIETVQFIFALGYTEVDDVINNTIGTLLGVLIWRVWSLKAGRRYTELRRDK